MSQKTRRDTKEGESKRLNRAVPAGEALGRVLDPALRRRGFASSDIITRWANIAPAPYDRVTQPDRLAWPRGSRGTEGATLYLRCAEGHALALIHEGPRVAAEINRYFGYVLVGAVRISPEPFLSGAVPDAARPLPSPEAEARVNEATRTVGDPEIRIALQQLGSALATGKQR